MRERPAAVVNDRGVLARNRCAAAAGVTVGMRVAEAVTHAADLLLIPDDPPRVQRAWDAILDLLDSLSPVVEDAGPGFALADLTGVRGERAAVARTLRSLATLQTFTARAAVADGPFTATVAARRGAAPVTVVPRGASPAYLAPLPVGVLPLPGRMRSDLALLGVRTVGAYAGLRFADVGRRFGAFGVAAFSLAIGRDDRPLFPRPRERKEQFMHTFDPPTNDLTPALFVTKALLDAHAATLRREGLTAAGVRLTLTCEAGDPLVVEQRWGEAGIPGRPALEALRLALEKTVAGAGGAGDDTLPPRIAAVSLSLLDCQPAVGVQLSLFDAATVGRRTGVAHLLAQLHALLGPMGVVEDVPVAAYLPEEGWVSRPACPAQIGAPPASLPDPTLALVPALPGFVCCQPPEPVRLVWGGETPAMLVTGSAYAEVQGAFGPYLAAGRWWEGEGVDRAYWLLVTGEGTLHLLAEDRGGETWTRIGMVD